MNIQPTLPVNFGIYKGTKPTRYGKIDTGLFKGNKIDVYYSYENNKIKHKLYYVTDSLGNWIKSKLIYFDDFGEKKVIKSNPKKR